MNENNLNYSTNSNKNSKLRLGILIGILICIILGLSGFIVYDKFIKDDNNDKQEINEPVKEKEEINKINPLTESEKDEIVELIDQYNSYFAKYLPISDINNIQNQLKLKFLYSKIEKYYDGFTVNQLEEIANKYFDNSFTYTNEDIKDDIGVLAKYNEATKSYEWVAAGYDGGDSDLGYSSKSYLIDSNYDSKNNLYAIKVKSLYTYCASVCLITDVYGSANTNDIILTVSSMDYPITKEESKAKVFLDCNKNSEDYNEEMCKLDLEDAAYKLGSQYVKETIYYFTKLDNGNFVLKSVK